MFSTYKPRLLFTIYELPNPLGTIKSIHISQDENQLKKARKIWSRTYDFGFISSEDFHRRMLNRNKCLILDIRTTEEFTNQEKKLAYRNRGHIQNAINIPMSDLTSRLGEIDKYKNKEVLTYTFSGNPESYASAKILSDNGFKEVKVMKGGLWNLRWRAANIKGESDMSKWVVDVPIENQ
ncbi:MAG: rhodanese-like domain-containing protein [Saprospiraceae bacterium]